jgi:spermidine synthase
VADPGATRMARVGSLFASAEDEIASVQAGITGGRKALWVAGAGMTRLTVDAKLMALMPEFTRPAATRMLVIAFGMGSSFRTGLASGLTVDGIELVPSVPDMFQYFQADASQVLENPRGRVVIADGRNYVALTQSTYDIVVVDPPPPIESSGTAVLYAREFYQAVADRLSANGVMMQWLAGVGSVEEFRTQVRTFSSVFPNVMLAFGPQTGGVYMLGSPAPLSLDGDAIASVLDRPGVVADLDQADDAPVSTRDAWLALIPTLRWLNGPAAVRFAGDGPIASDDRPYTEYFILRRAFGPRSPTATKVTLRAAAGP